MVQLVEGSPSAPAFLLVKESYPGGELLPGSKSRFMVNILLKSYGDLL